MSTSKIPVMVITGFLGSGKTTLLNRLLVAGTPNTAVIINEFGGTPVDPALIERQGLPMTTLAGGCLCCQIKGTLAPTLRNLWMARQQTPRPFQRMIIETSGIASPEPILDTLLRDKWLSSRYHLRQVIATLAIPSAIAQLERHAETKAQVAWADTLLLTHADLANDAQKTALAAVLDGLAPATPRFETITTHYIAEQMNYRPPALRRLPGRENRPTHGFSSLSLHLQTRLSWRWLQSVLQDLLSDPAMELVRIKGVVWLSNQPQPMVIQAAGQRLYPPAPLAGGGTDDLMGRLVFITHASPEILAEWLLRAFDDTIDKNALRLHTDR